MRAGLRGRAADPGQLDFFGSATGLTLALPARPVLPAEAREGTVPSPPPLPPAEIPTEPVRNARNYRITDADRLGEGSLKRKCADNLAALDVLRRIEAERREATGEEKRTLVRYVGWGGLPQVFDDANLKWLDEARLLRELLSDEEH
ncbi:MAG TPA: hypothetical protein PKE47_14650, partial [Verrucomicrobiota bacterium]|nr:hypothetical protein [Verrucomicrobiota bacterium]